MKNKTIEIFNKIKDEKPLVHHITNYVTVNDCANVTLAIGASPIMADFIEEVEDIVAISSAVVLNIGTVHAEVIRAMIKAGKAANAQGKPVILDPVGIGASKTRNNAVKVIMDYVNISVIRCNMAEIKFLCGENVKSKGVDSSIETNYREVKKYAEQLNKILAVTGATDIISDGKRTLCIKNGSPVMSRITGTGCMCSSLTGAFCSVTDDNLMASAAAISVMGIAGELAHEDTKDKGTGSFHMSLIDKISTMNNDTILKYGRIYDAF